MLANWDFLLYLQNTQILYSEFYLVIYNIIYCTENVPIVISDDDIENDFDLSKKVREISLVYWCHLSS